LHKLKTPHKANSLSFGESSASFLDTDPTLIENQRPPRPRAVMFDLDEVVLVPKEFYPDVLAKQHNFTSTELAWSKEFMEVLEGRLGLVDYLASFEHTRHLPIEEIKDIVHNKWPQAEGVVDHEVIGHILELKALEIKIVAATNNPPQKCDYVQNVLLPGIFDAFLASWDLKKIKTDPLFFIEGIDVLKEVSGLEDLNPKEIVFFDDNAEYVDTAAGLGIDARLYNRPQQVRALVHQQAYAY